MLYFAYGSNMSVPRIKARIPTAEFITIASLRGFRLTFSKPGCDHSGKCDVIQTGQEDDAVFGVVYRISALDKPILDRYEGLGIDYLDRSVALSTPDGDELRAYLYVATEQKPQLRPYDWYKTHVLCGAREAGLPAAYVASIAAVAALPDPDPERTRKELSIYPPCPADGGAALSD